MATNLDDIPGHPNVTQVEGTSFWAVKDDANLTPKIEDRKIIALESGIADLPEVKALKPGQIVLDIGAFIGDTAWIFLSKGCEVHAFEPYQDAYTCLKHNCPKAHCYNVAVGDGRDVCLDYMRIEGNAGTRGVCDPANGKAIRTQPIDLLSFVDKVAFVKIDVEGFEPAVLDGMRILLTRDKPTVLIEVYDTMLEKRGFNRADVLDRLKKLGYKLRVAVGEEEADRLDYIAACES